MYGKFPILPSFLPSFRPSLASACAILPDSIMMTFTGFAGRKAKGGEKAKGEGKKRKGAEKPNERSASSFSLGHTIIQGGTFEIYPAMHSEVFDFQ